MRPTTRRDQRSLGRDFTASLVVFLVALPLCMGIAIASGVPPALGLITGIVGGLVVGFIAGSPLQVSGPAAGLAVLVWELVQTHGLAGLGVVVLLAGALQLVAGLLRLGQWFRAVSPAVIQGMLAGIGVLIFASQFHVMVDDAPKGSGIANLLSIPEAVVKGVVPYEGTAHHQAAALGLLTIVTLVLWSTFSRGRLRVLPAALVAVVVASGAAALFGTQVLFVDVPQGLLGDLSFATLGNLSLLADGAIITAALAMAFVASAESLLCATAVDRMNPDGSTDYDRELAAQGVGNMLCGLLGALPMTGVIVRSSANVQAGARTRASTILHGAWLLLLVAALPFVLELIPTSALAAILVFTGYKLANPQAVRDLWRRYGWQEVAIYGVTVVTIVAVDLLTGVLAGIGLAGLKLLIATTRLDVEVDATGDREVEVRLRGSGTFLGIPHLARALEAIPPGHGATIRLDDLRYADSAVLDYLRGYEQRHTARGGQLRICWDTLASRYHGAVNSTAHRTVGNTPHSRTAAEA